MNGLLMPMLSLMMLLLLLFQMMHFFLSDTHDTSDTSTDSILLFMHMLLVTDATINTETDSYVVCCCTTAGATDVALFSTDATTRLLRPIKDYNR